MKIFIFVLLVAFSLTQKQPLPTALEQQAITALTQETQDVINQYAGSSAAGLISSTTGETAAEFWYCATADLNATLQGLPQNIIDQFNEIAFSASTEFESFSSYLTQNYTYVYEMVGTAMANSTSVAVGISQVYAVGTTIQQYSVSQSCSTCWLVGTCCKNVSTPIGFTTSQEDQMVNYLTEVGYQHLLGDMPTLAVSQDHAIPFKQPYGTQQ